jgi:3-isopropylmalate/(R)-2-methylmalate dehydratase large subunit
MEERMTLCNMAIECGGKNAIIAPDDTTFNYLKGKSKYQETLFISDDDYSYSFKKSYDACSMKAMVAKPPKPDNVVPACELSHQTLTRAYIGSCTGGKITDFMAAAKILKGQKVKVDTFIVPATTKVEHDLKTIKIEEKTLMDIFIESGCKIGLPSCAACLGGPEDTFGRSNRYEKVISTTNRNFPGRMGNSQTEIFLASPYTVAASALTGKITDPKEFVI